MSESTTDEPDARGAAKVKNPKGHGSHRITPPLPVREAVGMERDEPWSWFYHAGSDRFWLRRAGATLDGIPDEAVSAGVAEARQNGRYLDFAIPTSAVEIAEMAKGQQWTFRALDRNTMDLARESDE